MWAVHWALRSRRITGYAETTFFLEANIAKSNRRSFGFASG